MTDNPPPPKVLGGPALLAMKVIIGHAQKPGDHDLAVRLLRANGLIDAIELAAAELRKQGRKTEAKAIAELAVPFRGWPREHLVRLKDVGVQALLDSRNVDIVESDGPWRIEYMGGGRIELDVPAEFRCGPTALTDAELDDLKRRAGESS